MVGIAEGCRQAGVAIVGGEMAEHPGLLNPGELDVAGFAVGVVERDAIIDGPARTCAGDMLVGLASPGLRSNGYSLARAALLDAAGRRLDDPAWDGAGDHTLADELLRPSLIYSPTVLEVIASGIDVHAVAHITGGGLPGNLPRVLSQDVDAVMDRSSWETPRIFYEIQDAGAVTDEEMARVFNLGLGMVIVVPERQAQATVKVAERTGRRASVVGRLVAGTGRVEVH
jgi:phosphoribosylformylglycinamidine cyclo-ligase